MTYVMNSMRKLFKIFYTGFKSIEKAFLNACVDNDLKKVQECIELGVDVNCKSSDYCWFGLKIAVRENNEELLDLLLSQPNINVNNRDTYQNTALIVSCYKKQFYNVLNDTRTRACTRPASCTFEIGVVSQPLMLTREMADLMYLKSNKILSFYILYRSN